MSANRPLMLVMSPLESTTMTPSAVESRVARSSDKARAQLALGRRAGRDVVRRHDVAAHGRVVHEVDDRELEGNRLGSFVAQQAHLDHHRMRPR